MGKMLAEAGVGPDRVRAELGRGQAARRRGRPAAPRPIRRRLRHPPGLSRPTSPQASETTLAPGPAAAVPVSIVLGYVLHAPAVWVFFTACLGVLPLAGYMGEATEHLAHRTGPTIGGLLNATFGNAAELIIAIVALRAGLVDLVKASITGSILGNLLLILGLSLIAGGLEPAGAAVQPHHRRHERRDARAVGRGPGVSGAVPLGAPGGRGPAVGAAHVRSGGGDPHRHLRLLAAVHPPDPPDACSAARRIRWTARSGARPGHPGPRGGHRGRRGRVRAAGPRRHRGHRGAGPLERVPRAHRHPDHRQRRGACRGGHALPEGPDRSRPPDRAGLEHPDRPAGGAASGVRRRAAWART